MKYQVTNKGLVFNRTTIDPTASLRITCTGEYPVEVLVNNADEKEKIIIQPWQSFELAITNTRIDVGSWGGNSEITLYRVTSQAVDTCDFNGKVNDNSYVDNNLFVQGDLQVNGDASITGNVTASSGEFTDAVVIDGKNVNTELSQLGLSKTSQGFLAFTATGTTQAVLAKQTKLTKAFSLCFTFIAPDSVPSSLSAGKFICYSLGDPSQAAAVGFVFQWATWWDNKAQQGFLIGIKNKTDAAGSNNSLFLPYSTVSDGKPHAVAIIASPDSSVSTDGNNGKIRAYVDGVLKASTDAFVADTDNQNSRFTFSNTFGRLARMCRFNFDISAADAPYTLADYTSGKAIPAALNAAFNFSADGSTWEPMKMSDNTTLAPATVSVTGDVITITTTAEISEAFFRIKLATAIIKGVDGQTLHASVESFSGIGDSRGLGVKPMINDGEIGQINLTTNTKSGTWSMDRPFNSVNLTIRYGTSPIPSGTVFTITGLRVWTNGSVVALDDYTFGGKIRDISGNDNHATVSTTNGVRIHGDKDEAVQQMYEAFSAQYTTDNP